jgi:Flp pilus assembly protein TadG
MSRAFAKCRRGPIGEAGSTSLEFALVAVPFLFLLIAGMDLGRYFITQHSLRTLGAEAMRATLIQCFGQTTACTLPTANRQSAIATVPYLMAGSTVLTASQTAPAVGTGFRTVTVTAQYPFAFILPAWTGLNVNSPLTETMSFQY